MTAGGYPSGWWVEVHQYIYGARMGKWVASENTDDIRPNGEELLRGWGSTETEARAELSRLQAERGTGPERFPD